jgi:hypothetical protein
MKTNLLTFCATLLLAVSTCLNAEENPATKKPTSPEFERLKTLVGTWKGISDIGQGPMEMTVQYRLLAGGTVLEERCLVGTPNEMITMYYEKDGKLALTHYCMMGNRPGMLLKSSDANTMKFDFDKTCGIDVTKETHMNALTLMFNDTDTITVSCKAIIEGKEAPEHPTTLKRVKAS